MTQIINQLIFLFAHTAFSGVFDWQVTDVFSVNLDWFLYVSWSWEARFNFSWGIALGPALVVSLERRNKLD